MIVSHEKSFIYVAIPKTGSRTIQEFFRPYANLLAVGSSTNNHITINKIIELENFNQDLTSNLINHDIPYTLIANMRNPWERTVSFFEYVRKYQNTITTSVIYKHLGILLNNTSGTKDIIKLIFTKDTDYQKNWLNKHNIEKECRGSLKSYFQYQTQKYSYMEDYLNYSKYKEKTYIIRFENLQQDFNFVCGKLSIEKIKLPHKNKTKHKHYTEYFDDETKATVAERYLDDIQYMNYKFGE
jgi:hypothetical protein